LKTLLSVVRCQIGSSLVRLVECRLVFELSDDGFKQLLIFCTEVKMRLFVVGEYDTGVPGADLRKIEESERFDMVIPFCHRTDTYDSRPRAKPDFTGFHQFNSGMPVPL
jgi:hypothetical protein